MKKSVILLAALAVGVVMAVAFLARPGGGVQDGRSEQSEVPRANVQQVRGPVASATTAAAPRQTSTVRGTYPFEIALAEGVQPRRLNGIVNRSGARIVSYLPRGGAIVEATDEVIAKLRAMPEIASVGECEPSTKFAPGFRERLAQAGADESVRFSLSLINAEDAQTVSQQIAADGGTVHGVTDPKSAFQWISAELPAARIAAFADRAEVKWLEPVSRIRFCNATAVKADHMDVERVWDKGDGLGLSGAGQVIGHMDTGIDYGTTNNLTPEFAGHIKAYFNEFGGVNLSDIGGHGTHTAGSIVGQGVAALGGKFRGVAYGAQLVHHALGYHAGADSFYVSFDDLNRVFAQDYDLGVRIHSDSWGGNAAYDALAQSVDQFVWEHPNFLPVMCAGNEGPKANTVRSPATAKSALAVGSSENHIGYVLYTGEIEPDKAYSNAVCRGLADSSSRGARTGLFKPDIVAPGECIVSVRSLATVKETDCPVYTNETACGARYGWMNGTSAATPQVAGAMALMREWYMKKYKSKEPSAAMLAAMAVGGAHSLYPGRYAYPTNTQMTVRGPNPDEGWGEIGVAATLEPTNGLKVALYDRPSEHPKEDDLKNDVVLFVTNSSHTLTVALSWIDYPSDPSNPGLINDYDLELYAPDGTIYYPNGLDRADKVNVHEVTVVTNAMVGRWTAAVRSWNVATNGNAIALYVRGALGTEADLPRKPTTIDVSDSDMLAAALKGAQSGDTLKLKEGRYRPFTVSNITLAVVGAGADKTFVDGGGTDRCIDIKSPGGRDRVVVEGVTLENGSANEGAGIFGGTLRRSVIRNCRALIRGGGASEATLDHCVISNCWVEATMNDQIGKDTMFEGGGADRSTLYNCLVAHCGVSNVISKGETVFATRGGGVSLCNLCNVSVIDSQLFWTHDGKFVDAEYCRTNGFAIAIAGDGSGGSIGFQNSLFSRTRLNGKETVENLLGMHSGLWQCSHVEALSTNDFINFAADDFRLSSNAVLAIDCGVSAYLDDWPKSVSAQFDLAETNRVQGLSVDLGCYESPYTNTVPGKVTGEISLPGNIYMLAMGVGDPSIVLQDVSMVNDSYQMVHHAAAYLPVPHDNLVHLSGTGVTLAAVTNGMDSIVHLCGTNDLVLLTISTHGNPNLDSTNGVPIAGSENRASLVEDDYLYPNQIRDFESRLKAKGAKLVCVYDFCYAGAFAAVADVPALAATTEQEQSYDGNLDSFFNEAFLSLWRRPPAAADLNNDGILSFYEMGLLLGECYNGVPYRGSLRAEVTMRCPETLATIPLRRMPTNHEALAVLTTELPRMYSGMTYRYQLQATGGDGTNTWEALSELPGGLTLEKDGILHGIPQSVQMPTNLVVRVSDASGATVTASIPVEDVLFREDSRPRIVLMSAKPGIHYRQQNSGDWRLDISAKQPVSTNDIAYVFKYIYKNDYGNVMTNSVTNTTGQVTVPQTCFANDAVLVTCFVSLGNTVPVLNDLLWTVMNDPATSTKYFYLDPGRGTNDGFGTVSAPFWSFTNAIAAAGNVAESNVVIFVDNSKNGHQFNLDQVVKVDVPGKKITLQSWRTATSDVFNVVLDGQGKYACVMAPDSVTNKVTFKNFTLRNGSASAYGGGASSVTLVDSVITNCTSKGNGGGAYKCTLKNCRIIGCSSDGNGGGAAYSYLYNCLVLNNRAMNAMGGGAYHSSVCNCTFDGNTAKSGGGCIWSEENDGPYPLILMNSIILDNGTNTWKRRNRDDVVCRIFTDGDPKFVDAATGDYRLSADSPCIDFGYSDPAYLPVVDLDGNPRLRGAEIDLGCYEFQRHAAFQPGTLDVSTNAQVVGTVLYAQGPWRISVDDAAMDWLSADVTSGSVTNTLRFTFAQNATGEDRSAVVSVFTNGLAPAVQKVTVRQIGSASGCAGTRRGVFIGCAKYEKVLNEEKTASIPWPGSDTQGSDEDARFFCKLWCAGLDATNDSAVCQLLVNDTATSNNVLAAMNAVIGNLESNDEFMLVISGHGETAVPGWKNRFTLYPNEQYLSFSEISNCLIGAASKCAKVICYIDACNAAGVYKFADQLTCDSEITDRRDMPRLTFAAAVPSQSEPYKNETRIAFIVASDYDQFAVIGSPNSKFTGALRAGCESWAADADGNGLLDLHELYRYAYYRASDETPDNPNKFVQGRCYNNPLLLKTIVGEPGKAVKPDILNPLNPYYVDFVNWIQDGTLATIYNPFIVNNVTDVVTNSATRVPLAGGGSMSLAEAFVAGYAPVQKGVTNAPFTVSIAVTNGTPYLSWSPDRRQDAAPMRSYEIKANTSLTNQTNWTTLPASATPEQLKPYSFFKVDVKLRQ